MALYSILACLSQHTFCLSRLLIAMATSRQINAGADVKSSYNLLYNNAHHCFDGSPQGEQGLPGASGQDGPPGPMVSTSLSLLSPVSPSIYHRFYSLYVELYFMCHALMIFRSPFPLSFPPPQPHPSFQVGTSSLFCFLLLYLPISLHLCCPPFNLSSHPFCVSCSLSGMSLCSLALLFFQPDIYFLFFYISNPEKKRNIITINTFTLFPTSLPVCYQTFSLYSRRFLLA